MSTTKTRRKNGTDTISMAEEAVHLLRFIPGGAFLRYYMGTLPFILGLLYFWADMTKSPFASQRLVPGAVVLTVLFAWMKFWQTHFSRNLMACLTGASVGPLTFRRSLRVAARQMFIHSTGLFLLPVAGLFMLPFAWVYAFYQNATLLEEGSADTLTRYCRRCWGLAQKWPLQNHMLLTILFFFGLFVFLNIAAAIFMLPHLVNKLLGIESLFTLSGTAVLNTTFLIVVAGLSYLCLDPLVKAVYALRCFYGRSVRTGEDMLATLNRLSLAGVLLFLTTGAMLYGIEAGAENDAAVVTHSGGMHVAPDPQLTRDLDKTIADVLERREFTWRLPRKEEEKTMQDSDSWIFRMFAWIADSLKATFFKIGDWIKAFFDWLDRLMPDDDYEKKERKPGWNLPVRPVFHGFCIVAAVVLLYLLVRVLKRKRTGRTAPPSPSVTIVPDLSDESIKADDLPTDRWLALAREHFEKEAFRHAVRAIYLAVLAHLSEKERIKIAKHKSNREYREELSRRFRDDRELRGLFAGCIGDYERVWYGTTPAERADVERFFGFHERLRVILG